MTSQPGLISLHFDDKAISNKEKAFNVLVDQDISGALLGYSKSAATLFFRLFVRRIY